MNELELFLNLTNYFTTEISDLKHQLSDALASDKAEASKLQEAEDKITENNKKNATLEQELTKYQNLSPSNDNKASLLEALQTVSQHVAGT